MAGVSNSMEKRKIDKPGTAERTAWHRRQSVDQFNVTVLTNQRTLADNRCRCVEADICQNVCVGHSQLPWPAVNA